MSRSPDHQRLVKILQILTHFFNENGYPPSLDEVTALSGMSQTNVHDILKKLAMRGFIPQGGRRARSYRVTPAGWEFLQAHTPQKDSPRIVQRTVEFVRVPVAGAIVAGEPIPMPGSDLPYFDDQSVVEVLLHELPSTRAIDSLFALEVRGDSMIDALVNDGDIVVVQPVEGEVHNGDMVAAWYIDEDGYRVTTLKYFYKEGDVVRLQPANKAYQPIIVRNLADMEVKGKVVKVIHRL